MSVKHIVLTKPSIGIPLEGSTVGKECPECDGIGDLNYAQEGIKRKYHGIMTTSYEECCKCNSCGHISVTKDQDVRNLLQFDRLVGRAERLRKENNRNSLGARFGRFFGGFEKQATALCVTLIAFVGFVR